MRHLVFLCCTAILVGCAKSGDQPARDTTAAAPATPAPPATFSLADVAGTRSTEVDLGEGLTAADAYRLLCREHPDMEGLGGSLMYAVNAEYVHADHPLRDGDELALIPPVSGGSPHSVILSARLPQTPAHAATRVLGNGSLTGAKNLAVRSPRAPARTGSWKVEHGNGRLCSSK